MYRFLHLSLIKKHVLILIHQTILFDLKLRIGTLFVKYKLNKLRKMCHYGDPLEGKNVIPDDYSR
ncbi:unnamed protein product [Rhodiola kirilowii]